MNKKCAFPNRLSYSDVTEINGWVTGKLSGALVIP